MKQIKLNDITINIIQKKIKNMYLSVKPPLGEVKISAPKRMSLKDIERFVLSKIHWIRKNQNKFKQYAPKPPVLYNPDETHHFFGQKYNLKIIELNKPPRVIVSNNEMKLYIRPKSNFDKRKQVIEEWYRTELKKIVPLYIDKWLPILGVTLSEFGIKKMKTKWGTCNTKKKKIWINLELAKKNIHCLEYIVVHELVHLIEIYHNKRFYALMDKFLPNWKVLKAELNSE